MSNADQIALWRGRLGVKWAENHRALDGMLTGLTDVLVRQAGPVTGKRVLDVGCGTGETCNLWLDQQAQVTGLDVSPDLLAIAHEVTRGRATLVEADASVWKGEETFDLAFSRFGLMFFNEPQQGFSNIGSNLRPGGQLVFCCWRSVSQNPWVTAPLSVVQDLFPAKAVSASAQSTYSPGPFALSEIGFVSSLVETAGFERLEVRQHDFPVVFSNHGVEAAAAFALQMGPTAAALNGAEDSVRRQATGRLEQLFARYEHDGLVALQGSAWVVVAARKAR
jgi:SAM-dependent methyltransferase